MTEPNDNEVYDDLLPDAVLEFSPSFDEAVKHSDIAYICDYIYPYLQIANPQHGLAAAKISIIEAKNDWKIVDYGEILSAAAPHDKTSSLGYGTIVKQQFDVAFEMMELVKQRHWGKIGDEGGEGGKGELKPETAQILGGTPMMERFAWFAAKVLGINLDGFTPTAEDQKWLEKLYDKYVAQEKAAGKEILNSKF